MREWRIVGLWIALSVFMVACSADPAPEPGQRTAPVVESIVPPDLTGLPAAEWDAVGEAAIACRQPLPDASASDGKLWTGLTVSDLRDYYAFPPSAVDPGWDCRLPSGPLGRCDAPFYRDPATGAVDGAPCGWNHSAMIQHAVVKCLAQRYQQAAFDPARALSFESRARLIGRARFSYFFTIWQAWAELTQTGGFAELPYACPRNEGAPEPDLSLMRLGNEPTVEWFAASVAESMEALTELGHRQSAMVAARADERRGEVPDLLTLQREAFDHGVWPNSSYLTALWLLVGQTTTPPAGFHDVQGGKLEYCKSRPYEESMRSALATEDTTLPAPAHWCFYGGTVDARRPAVQRGIAWIHRIGPTTKAALAARAGHSTIEELGLTTEGWRDAVRYFKEDATLTGLYPDGPAGIRLEVPPFIFRSQIRELLPTSLPARQQITWDQFPSRSCWSGASGSCWRSSRRSTRSTSIPSRPPTTTC